MTNPFRDNSEPHAVVRVYDIEAEPGVVHEVIHFYGDCVTTGRQCAEEWLRAQGYVPINIAGTSWEEQGIGSHQAALEESKS